MPDFDDVNNAISKAVEWFNYIENLTLNEKETKCIQYTTECHTTHVDVNIKAK